MTLVQARPGSSSLRLRLALAVALAALSSPAMAQQSGETLANAARVYEAADFARFAPQTALDMLNQTPGFTIREAEVERGLGQATGNVLLNGQRIANKSDDILAQLQRIPARDVVRIEIREGATLGIPGLSGQVANVVTASGGLHGRWAYRPEFRRYFTDPLLTRFETSLSGEHGPIQFTLGLENQASHSGAGGDTHIRDASGNLLQLRDDIWTGDYDPPRLSARLAYHGADGAIGNFNAALQGIRYRYVENGVWDFTSDIDRHRLVLSTEDGWNYEIGGDYEFVFGPGQLKIIGLDRRSDLDDETAVRFDYTDASPDTGDRSTTESVETERVLRGEYVLHAGPATWQLSGEAAFNALDSATRLFSLTPLGDEVETPFPGGDARVEETRYEVIGAYSRPLASSLSLQLSGGAEYSELVQAGAGGVTRTFVRPKGALNLVWQANSTTTLNARIQRTVGQLDFYDFLASRDLGDDTSFAANPNLVPPQSWEGELELSRNWGAWGSSTIRIYGELIDDIVDVIPIGTDQQAVGNLDSAVRYGVEWRATTNFEPIGLAGLKLDSAFTIQESAVDDPLTGETREIGDSLLRQASLNLRYDIPATDWAVGGALRHESHAKLYRLGELYHQYEIPLNGSLFIENKNVFELTVRAQLGNMFSGESYLFRTVHEDGRRTSPVDFTEHRDRTIGPIVSIDIRGRF